MNQNIPFREPLDLSDRRRRQTVVTGDRICALVILAHTLALSVIVLLPAYYRICAIHMAGAVAGGALFTWTSFRLALHPTRKNALTNFPASFLQLCLLLGGAMADRTIGII